MFLSIAALGGGSAADGGAASGALAALCREYWEARLAANPLEATGIGDRRFDDRLDDNTPEGMARERAQLETLRERLRAVPQGPLGDADRLTLAALSTEIEADLDRRSCALHEWTVDPLAGPQVEFFNIESYQPVRTPAEARAMVARWRAMGPYLDQAAANLRRGLAAERVAPAPAVEKAIGGLEDVLAEPDERWALLAPLAVEHADWSEAERREFRDGLTGVVRESVRPALGRFRDFLRAEILPRARPQDQVGIGYLSGGHFDYRKLMRVHTSLDRSPDEVHQLGMREVERINNEMRELGRRALGATSVAETLARLRGDAALYFADRDEVAAKAESALARARAALPEWFGILPRAGCEVVRMGEHEEKVSTIAYYRQPAADGSRPGRYYVNTYAPHTRPRYEAEALAYHESIPGHHLQLAIAQELTGLPEFRKHVGVTAYVEGWGLYAERLAEEMGLYSSDLDRIGVLSFDAWRACRLVVDTGMHAKGWSRRQAIDFMLANTALAENNVVNEVDRYIVWPGQALAYKTGQLEILRLRAQAVAALGEGFDIRRFHDVVLSNGAVALGPLARLVEEYIGRGGAA